MGRKHFIKSDRARVFSIVPSKDVAGKRHREAWLMALPFPLISVFQRPLKEGDVLWWQGLIHQASGADP